ncbi:MAG: N-acetyltransferase family protein [Oscillospiraceae bacterium]|nr:N-acetyltransferase family protein [Oscillospiraceae bacterium]
MALRFAAEEDAGALLDIYAPYIATPTTFECALPTRREFSARIAAVSSFYPYLVCERDGRPAGYAYAHRQMERAAYGWNAELSVYLAPEATSQGLGTELYRALLGLLALQGIRNVYAGVTLPNERSERLHESFGFSVVGDYRRTGWKCGAWRDVRWYGKQLPAPDGEPLPPVAVSALPRAAVARILAGG